MDNLKQDDLQDCLRCSRGMMHDNEIQFYRVKIESFLVDRSAIQRQHGLEMSMGAAAPLARIMGPNQDLAIGVSEASGLVCQSCFFGSSAAALWECALAGADDSDHAEGSTA